VTHLSLARGGNARSRQLEALEQLEAAASTSAAILARRVCVFWFSMGKRFKLGAGLLLATGTFTISLATPAKAANCVSGLLTSFAPLAFTCTTGGFTFTLNSVSGYGAGVSLNINTFSNNLLVNTNNPGLEAGSSGVLNYTIVAPSGRALSAYTSVSSGIFSTSGNINLVGAAGSAQANVNSGLAFKTYAQPISSDTFTNTVSATSGSIISWNTSYATIDAPPRPWPTPHSGRSCCLWPLPQTSPTHQSCRLVECFAKSSTSILPRWEDFLLPMRPFHAPIPGRWLVLF
jgi:hypothetical protein